MTQTAIRLVGWPGAEAFVFNTGMPLPDGIVLPVQTHTANVQLIAAPDQIFDPADTDGLVTTVPGMWVGVRTADCVPLVLYAPDIRAVAAVHAGWKGTEARIAGRAVQAMMDAGADPGLMLAAFGPHICVDCYEVSDELTSRFVQAGFGASVSRRYGCRPHLSLEQANRTALAEAGLSCKNIQKSEWCTLHTGEPCFPSWRRQPGIQQRLITAVRLL